MKKILDKYSSSSYLILIGFAILIRILFLFNRSDGVNQDELTNIYDAWSIAETGTDRFGSELPWELRGFGHADYRPALNAYLISIVFFFTGPSILTARLFSLLIGIIGLLFFRKVCVEISSNKVFHFWALALLCLSPWHIVFSVTAIEGTILFPTLFISSIFFWLKQKNRGSFQNLILLIISLSLFSYSYQAAKLVAFLLGLIIAIDLLLKKEYKNFFILSSGCLIITSPYLFESIYYPSRFFARTYNILMDVSPIYTYGVIYFLENITKNLNPAYLFLEVDQGNNLSVFRALIVESLFFYVGLFSINQKIIKNKGILIICFISAIIPCALTKDNPHALRLACLMYLIPLFSSLGLILIIDKISLSKRYIHIVFGILCIGCLYFQSRLYFTTPEMKSGYQIQTTNFYKRLSSKKITPPIYIEHHGNQPYLYLAYYNGISPEIFKQTTKVYFSQEKNMDHYTRLGNVNWNTVENIDSLIKSGKKGTFIHHTDSLNETLPFHDTLSIDTLQYYFYYQ